MTRIFRRERLAIFIAFFAFGATFFARVSASTAAATSQVSATAKVAVCGNEVREGGENCDGVDLAADCQDFGFTSGTLSCQPACEYGFSACTTTADAVDTVSFSTATGGQHSLTNADGTSAALYVPSGFTVQDASALIFSYPNETIATTRPAPAGTSFVGQVYDVKFVDEDGNLVSTLSHAATMTLGYTAADVASLDEATIVPYHRSDATSAWQAVAGATVDTTADTVTFPASSFSLYALAASPASRQASPAGSGGGLGGYEAANRTVVTFVGHAFSNGSVTLLMDGQEVSKVGSDAAAAFSSSAYISEVGPHTFSLYADDVNGARSVMLTFPVVVVSGTPIKITDVFFPPTVSADSFDVQKGGTIRISGQSVPNSEIIVTRGLGNEPVAKIPTKTDGSFEFMLDTSVADVGEYDLRVKVEHEAAVSPFGRSLRLTVRPKSTFFSLPVRKSGVAAKKRPDGAVAITPTVELSKLPEPAAPAREVFRKQTAASEAPPAPAPAVGRSRLSKIFSWLAGIARSFSSLFRR